MARPTATLDSSRTEMTELLLPNETNNLGRALGGTVLHWMDLCAAMSAMRFSGRQCVTASMDHTDFLSPIDLGEVFELSAYVFRTGRTSVDCRVSVHAEDPKGGRTNRRKTTTSFFTFVALDEEGKPTEVPKLVCGSDESQALREKAIEEQREQLAAVAERLERTE
jgi:acyl-CoA hydrolase